MTTLIPMYEQVVNDGFIYCNGLNLQYTAARSLNVTAGQTRDSTNIMDIVVPAGANPPVALTINFAANGANGLDTGTIAASTMYFIFIAGDITGQNVPCAFASTSLTSPVVPSGYTYTQRIGCWPTDGSSNLLLMYQSGYSMERNYVYDAPVSILSGGTATMQTALTQTKAVPTLANIPVIFDYSFTPASGGAGHILTLLPSGSASTTTAIVTGPVASVAVTGQISVPNVVVSGASKVDYLVSNSSDAASLSVFGFKDVVGTFA